MGLGIFAAGRATLTGAWQFCDSSSPALLAGSACHHHPGGSSTSSARASGPVSSVSHVSTGPSQTWRGSEARPV